MADSNMGSTVADEMITIQQLLVRRKSPVKFPKPHMPGVRQCPLPSETLCQDPGDHPRFIYIPPYLFVSLSSHLFISCPLDFGT